ncbi:MAG: hypothetical protein CFH19_00462 [Alphaproteobacteria bacterium MarineAlpha5_Bin9]|nr:MAG: hypothetical protein CFH19_00462 [Alphaproteobacteria bacterium MarineAlpha5_Bin9]|tara:strand:- start:11753 stop:12664 length:912 start_codon:yes stop_codon:yes gene_type:complete
MIKSKNVFICFGAVHYDYLLKLKNNLIKLRTNPINQSKKIGGVAYNIAKILSIFSKVTLASLKISKTLKKEISNENIKILELNKKNIDRFYISLSDKNNNFLLGLANTINYEKNNSFIKNFPKLNRKIVILDLNFSKFFIKKLVMNYYKKNYIIVCGTSVHKVYKINTLLKYLDCIFLNKGELFKLTKIDNIKKSLKKIIKINKNIKIIVTNGSKNVYFLNKNVILKGMPPKIKIKDENGAGDALSAIMILLLNLKFNINKVLKYGIAAGSQYATGKKITKKTDLGKIHRLSKKIIIKKEYLQ